MFTTNSFSRNLVGSFGALFLGAVCIGAAAAPAQAAPAVRIAVVSTSDLNLSSAQGRDVLNHRLLRAAKSVCVADTGDLAARANQADCVSNALNTAKPVSATKA